MASPGGTSKTDAAEGARVFGDAMRRLGVSASEAAASIRNVLGSANAQLNNAFRRQAEREAEEVRQRLRGEAESARTVSTVQQLLAMGDMEGDFTTLEAADLVLGLVGRIREVIGNLGGERQEVRNRDGEVVAVSIPHRFWMSGTDAFDWERDRDRGGIRFTFKISATGDAATRFGRGYADGIIIPYLEMLGVSGHHVEEKFERGVNYSSVTFTYHLVNATGQSSSITERRVTVGEGECACTPFSWCSEHCPPGQTPIDDHPSAEYFEKKWGNRDNLLLEPPQLPEAPKRRRRSIRF